MRTLIDLNGQKFGKWTVLSINRTDKGKVTWKCRCECGQEKNVLGYNLVSKKSISCRKCVVRPKGSSSPNFKGYGDIPMDYWTNIIRGALKRNLSVSITLQDIWKLFLKQDKKCALTQRPLFFNSVYGKYDGNASLDRIDSLKGYELDNIQWIHKNINWMKGNFSQQEFINECRFVAKYAN
jgi:hypothetical protein